MTQQPSADQLNWSREEPIALPTPETEGRLAIRHSDWKRLMRHVRRQQIPFSNISIWYSICFGVAASTGVSIIPIANSTGLPPWVVPLYVVVTIASGLLGSVLVWLEKRLVKIERSALDDLEHDMTDIEEAFAKKGVASD